MMIKDYKNNDNCFYSRINEPTALTMSVQWHVFIYITHSQGGERV